jgi:hypothetical protein
MPRLSFADNAHYALPDYISTVDNDAKQLTRPQNERTVEFVRKVRVRRIPRRSTYTKEQREATYYTREEYKTIRFRLCIELKILKVMDPAEQNILDEDDEVCSRGLENETKHRKQQRKRNKILARSTVIGEQAHQRKIGDRDEMYLANLYWFRSQTAVQSAIEVARKDALEAQMYYLQETES